MGFPIGVVTGLACRSYKLTLTGCSRWLIFLYAYILCLDHPLYFLLAIGYPGPCAVSDLLVTLTAIPDIGYCGGWGVGVIERDYYVAGEGVAEAVNRVERRDILSV